MLLTVQDSFPFKHIEFITGEQGLNGREVDWITQDRYGFMWFNTDNGLNRFDGYTFRSWPHTANDSNGLISGDWHWGLTEDKNGVLWLPSELKGFYSFDPVREKFINYHHQQGNSNSLINDQAWAIATESSGNIWIGTAKGLDKYDPKTKTFAHFVHDAGDSASISYDDIFTIVTDDENTVNRDHTNIWLINKKLGIDCFDTKTGKVTKHFDFPFPKSDYLWEGNPLLAIKEIRNNVLWFGSNDNGIYGFNTLTEQCIHIKTGHPCEKTFVHIAGFYPVLEDHAGNLWTVNDNNELVYYDRANQKFYFNKVQWGGVYFNHAASVFFEDKSGKIWIGTTNGLLSIDTKQKLFLSSQPDDNVVFSISDNSIAHIQKVKNMQLSVSDNLLNLFWLKRKFYPFPFKQSPNLTNIYKDSKGVLWLAGESRIISYNPVTKKSREYKLYDNSSSENTGQFMGVVEDLRGRFWAANFGDGLYNIDTVAGKLHKFGMPGNINPGNANYIESIFKDSRGIIYLGIREGGFVTFNADGEIFKVYHHNVNDPNTVSSESATTFLEAKNGLIWFGTANAGLNVFNPATGKFKAFTTIDGLSDNYVRSLTEDKNGDYWVGTRTGISCFTPPDNPYATAAKLHFRSYDISDGLTSNICMPRSAFCDLDGTLYFGTFGGGLFYFHPDSLKENDFIPPVYITEFKLRNKPVSVSDSNSVLKSPVEFTNEIKLNYKQNMISFSFAALSYIHPEKNKYAYKLENFDKDWIYTDASKRFANYTNLDPGEYIFKVKGSNNDGRWNETPTELKIIITPPFWQTAWFRILVIVAIAGAVYAAYRYRLQQVLKLQQIRNRIAADLHDDIGSTLNSISVFSEVAKNDPSKRDESLDMIGNSSRKVTEAMSDIVWTINPDNDSFEKVILRMRSLSYNLLRAKDIEFIFRADEELNNLKLPMQKRKNFYLIFKEMLNNLVKYSKATHASFSLTNKENKNIILTVRDNGIGFDTTRSYSGNGLNNMLWF